MLPYYQVSTHFDTLRNFPKFIFLNKNRSPLKNFSVGERVFHEKFGYGSILSLEADKAVVDFEKSDQKNIKTGFLTHEKDV